MSIGNRIYTKRHLADPDIIEAFRMLPAANVADCMGRLCAMNPRIRLLSSPTCPMVGSALTIKARAGDNLMVHAAMELAQEGDVLVISNEGDDRRSLMGEIMFTYLRKKNVAGIVIDGPIRDYGEIKNWDFPIYATGSTPGGPYKEGPGEVNVPVACGEIEVTPGDIILGDADGVISISARDAAAVLEAAKLYHQKDNAKILAAHNGTADRSWVKKLLEKKEVETLETCWDD